MFIWVQVLRGLAAAMVVCHHYVASQAEKGISVSHWMLNFGGAGVDIFFVISGFIMMITQSEPSDTGLSKRSTLYSTRHFSAKDFLLRRLARIAPLYWALTVIAFSLVLAASSSVNTEVSPQKFLMSMLFLPYSETEISMSMSAHTAYVIPMAWTLTFEWFFYLVFALSLALGLKPAARLPFIALWFGLFVAAGFIFQPTALMLQAITNPIVFEFLFGCTIALVYLKGYRLSGTQALVLTAGALVILANFLHDTPVTRTLIWGSAAFALIAAATLYEGRKKEMPAIRPFSRLGDISYSLYLSHFFALALFVRLQNRFEFIGEGFGLFTVLAFVILTIGVAELCYRFIEEPARTFFKRYQHKGTPGVIGGNNGKRAI